MNLEVKSLTIVGASANPEKFGHKALKKALENKIKVYVVNPTARRIDVLFDDGKRWNVPTFPDVMRTPEVTDFVAVYTPREILLNGVLAEQIVKRGFPNIIVPPEKVINEKSIEESQRIKRYFQDRGYGNSNLLIDVCYMRDL